MNTFNPEQSRRLTRAFGRRLAAVTAASALAVGVGAGAWAASNPDAGATTPAAIEAIAPDPSRTIGSGTDSYAPIVSRVAPAVVTVRSERRVAAGPSRHPLFDDPRFRDFFGDRGGLQPGPQPRQGGLGSGVIVKADGYILTNHHVIDGADTVEIELSDRRTLAATVVGSDEASDLAVLKIDSSALPVVALGDSDAVQVGDVVLALGNPLGVGQTVTMGIISGKGRATGLGDGSFENFLQTDAPINSGNSGGALVNTRGELVGINSQILSPSGGNIGIGFSIPVNMARAVMDALIEHGEVRRGRLGVTIQPVTSDLARSLRLPEVAGALVNEVQDGGPADSAGVEQGDVIVGLNGGRISDGNELRNRVAQLGPGASVELTLVRDGKTRQVTATLEELPSRSARSTAAPAADGERAAGLVVEPLTASRARQLGLDAESGLLVTRVDPDGPAADAGLRAGDVIQQVDGEPIESAAQLKQSLATADRPALVLVQRGPQQLFVTIENSVR